MLFRSSVDIETNKNTTSLLSPYIRYRAISEKNILKQVLEIHGPIKAEKYIQEIFWRTYWKGWLEHRPEVYTDYIIEKNNLYDEFYSGRLMSPSSCNGYHSGSRQKFWTDHLYR